MLADLAADPSTDTDVDKGHDGLVRYRKTPSLMSVSGHLQTEFDVRVRSAHASTTELFDVAECQ